MLRPALVQPQQVWRLWKGIVFRAMTALEGPKVYRLGKSKMDWPPSFFEACFVVLCFQIINSAWCEIYIKNTVLDVFLSVFFTRFDFVVMRLGHCPGFNMFVLYKMYEKLQIDTKANAA